MSADYRKRALQNFNSSRSTDRVAKPTNGVSAKRARMASAALARQNRAFVEEEEEEEEEAAEVVATDEQTEASIRQVTPLQARPRIRSRRPSPTASRSFAPPASSAESSASETALSAAQTSTLSSRAQSSSLAPSDISITTSEDAANGIIREDVSDIDADDYDSGLMEVVGQEEAEADDRRLNPTPPPSPSVEESTHPPPPPPPSSTPAPPVRAASNSFAAQVLDLQNQLRLAENDLQRNQLRQELARVRERQSGIPRGNAMPPPPARQPVAPPPPRPSRVAAVAAPQRAAVVGGGGGGVVQSAVARCPICREQNRITYENAVVQRRSAMGDSGAATRTKTAIVASEKSATDQYRKILEMSDLMSGIMNDEQIIDNMVIMYRKSIYEPLSKLGRPVELWTHDMLREHFDVRNGHIFDVIREARQDMLDTAEVARFAKQKCKMPHPDNPGLTVLDVKAANAFEKLQKEKRAGRAELTKLIEKKSDSLSADIRSLTAAIMALTDADTLLVNPRISAGTMERGGDALRTVGKQVTATGGGQGSFYTLSGFQ